MFKKSILLSLSLTLVTPVIQANQMSAVEAAKTIVYAKEVNKALAKISQKQKKIENDILKNISIPNEVGITVNANDYYIEYEINKFLKDNFDKNYLNLIATSTAFPPLAYDFRKEGNKVYFKIPLDEKVVDFLKQVENLSTSVSVQKNKPSDKSKLWYKPDGTGGFLVYKYGNGKWELLEVKAIKSKANKNTNSTVVKSFKELQNIIAQKGDIAYVNKDDSSVQKYLYDGSQWMLQTSATTFKKVVECTTADVGVIKYIGENDCLSSCQKSGEKLAWECIEGASIPANTASAKKVIQLSDKIKTIGNLMWQDNADAKQIKTDNEYDASRYCENLILDGYSDWKLPTYYELVSVQREKFKNAAGDWYWSSTFAGSDYYTVFFNGEKVSKTYSCYVRCVRTK